jgi:hypothetical protein
MASDPITLILQGIVIAGIGLFVYQTGYRWFKGIGSDQFQSKEVAQVVIVGFLFGTGYISGPLLQAIESNVLSFTTIQQWGIVVIASRVLVNMMVPNWRADDRKSLIIIGFGALLFFWPNISG